MRTAPLVYLLILTVAGAARADPMLSEFGIDQLLVVRSKKGDYTLNRRFPWAFSAYDELQQGGYVNEIAVYDLATATFTTVFTPPSGRMVADIDLHWLGHKLLFSMPDGDSFHVYEIVLNGLENRTGTARRITPDTHSYVHNYDPAYAPDGSIVFCSTASYQTVPCWHGLWMGANLFRIESDGTGMRMLTHDQALAYTPVTLESGQIMYSRWNYINTFHPYYRTIMLMNPDGTRQRSLAGINSWWPPAIMYPRAVPGEEHLVVAIGLGHHGSRRYGRLLRYDVTLGSREAMGVVELPSGAFPAAVIRDALVDPNAAAVYVHPFPLDRDHTLVSRRATAGSAFQLFLVDASSGTETRLKGDTMDLFEPVPYRPRPRPHQRPNKTKDVQGNWLPSSTPARVYIDDIYVGPGLAEVPSGAVKSIRVGSYNFGYPGLGGPNAIGPAGPWETMRILGTVPVEADGSAFFEAPSMTPLFLQPLNERGEAMQVFRGWFTARPGEIVSCVGCHESPEVTPATGRQPIAALKIPAQIQEWHGPARGLDFERDVQPALDRHCVSCHQPGKAAAALDLRQESLRPDYTGIALPSMDRDRIQVDNGRVKYTPAYEALLPYVYRIGCEDTVDMHTPGEFHVLNSPLMQMLFKGHHGVVLDDEAWSRLTTWLDLNAPAHGRWLDVWNAYPAGGQAHARRMELFALYGGPTVDPEEPPTVNPSRQPVVPQPVQQPGPKPFTSGWPFSADQARVIQGDDYQDSLDLGGGLGLDLLRIPAGSFVMGAAHAYGSDDHGAWQAELPASVTSVGAFWMGRVEVSNAQFRRFDPDHRSGYFNERYQQRDSINQAGNSDGPGLALDEDNQPAVRVSWDQARAFCEWLSARTGRTVRLPSEAEWEWACRAGTETSHSYGNGGDFSSRANCADAALATVPANLQTGGAPNLLAVVPMGAIHCDTAHRDGFQATAPAGSFNANPWRLADMHGNAAEWTSSAWAEYPYDPDDGRNDLGQADYRVVRGGSFRDHPARCASAYRAAIPPWVRTATIGFRVVVAPLP